MKTLSSLLVLAAMVVLDKQALSRRFKEELLNKFKKSFQNQASTDAATSMGFARTRGNSGTRDVHSPPIVFGALNRTLLPNNVITTRHAHFGINTEGGSRDFGEVFKVSEIGTNEVHAMQTFPKEELFGEEFNPDTSVGSVRMQRNYGNRDVHFSPITAEVPHNNFIPIAEDHFTINPKLGSGVLGEVFKESNTGTNEEHPMLNHNLPPNKVITIGQDHFTINSEIGSGVFDDVFKLTDTETITAEVPPNNVIPTAEDYFTDSSKLGSGEFVEVFKVTNTGTNQIISIGDDHFTIDSKLGSGVFGDVFKVANMETNEVHAMKTFPEDAMKQSPGKTGKLRRISSDGIDYICPGGAAAAEEKKEVDPPVELTQSSREADMQKLVQPNPYAVRIDRDSVDSSGNRVLLLELLPDGELHHHIDRKRGGGLKPPYKPLPIFRQLVEGVSIMHNKNVVHRDLKPRNMFCNEHGGLHASPLVKIGDFGLATTYTPGKATMTEMRGTPAFASPEMWTAETTPYVGPEVDVWSLGVTLYMLLSGNRPFQPKQPEDDPRLARQIQDRIQSKMQQLATQIQDKIDHAPPLTDLVSQIREDGLFTAPPSRELEILKLTDEVEGELEVCKLKITDDVSLTELVRKIQDEDYDPLPEGVPADAKDLISHMLDKNPMTRWTIQQVAEHKWVTGEGNDTWTLKLSEELSSTGSCPLRPQTEMCGEQMQLKGKTAQEEAARINWASSGDGGSPQCKAADIGRACSQLSKDAWEGISQMVANLKKEANKGDNSEGPFTLLEQSQAATARNNAAAAIVADCRKGLSTQEAFVYAGAIAPLESMLQRPQECEMAALTIGTLAGNFSSGWHSLQVGIASEKVVYLLVEILRTSENEVARTMAVGAIRNLAYKSHLHPEKQLLIATAAIDPLLDVLEHKGKGGYCPHGNGERKLAVAALRDLFYNMGSKVALADNTVSMEASGAMKVNSILTQEATARAIKTLVQAQLAAPAREGASDKDWSIDALLGSGEREETTAALWNLAWMNPANENAIVEAGGLLIDLSPIISLD